MILKNIISKEDEIKKIENRLQNSEDKNKKIAAQQELIIFKNNYNKEIINTIFLNNIYRYKKNFYLLHDVCIQSKKEKIIINHILLSKNCIYIISSLDFNGKLTINNKNYLKIVYNNKIVNQENPFIFLNKAKKMLNSLLIDYGLFNVNFFTGIPIKPIVLITKNTELENKKLPKNFYIANENLEDYLNKKSSKKSLSDKIKNIFSNYDKKKLKEIGNFLVTFDKKNRF